jgi:hypothetical protein
MARKISLPLGKVSEQHIIPGIDAALSAIETDLKREFGAEARLESSMVLAQNEILRDNRTVVLKIVSKIVKLRVGVFKGSDIELTWRRKHPEKVCIRVSTASLFQDYCFIGTFVLAAVVAFGVCVSAGVFNRLSAMLAFFAVWLILFLPYSLIRFFRAVAERAFITSVEECVRRAIA